MTKYKFFIANGNNEIIGASNGYYDVFRKLPDIFTLDDINKQGVANAFNKGVLKRLERMRPTTILKVSKICGWSSRSGGAEYLVIKVVENQKYISLLANLENTTALLAEVRKDIYAKAGPLIDQERMLEKVLTSVKNQIKQFNETGELI